jgi:aspartyl-tRNA(Asn)/glutamyl-tRNA(Gln) amidotransferase subunit B
MKYEAVIGLEVHAQLGTKSKLFCSCSTTFGSPPNTNVCPVCCALPGALPVVNRQAVEYAVKTGIAFHCKINNRSIFARKSYFYPDLPKAFQISQYELPFAEHGWVEITVKEKETKRIGITRVHMEEDAGKNVHTHSESLVDLNRAGVPLIEIVSEPDMRSPKEAFEYFKKLYSILSYLEVCDCNMEEGNLRCDANVSVREAGAQKLGTKVEIKNLNSFRFMEKALEFEIERQTDVVESGGKIVQETRLFDSVKGITKSMRTKEQADDYRYFPEPDLSPLIIDENMLKRIKASLPELPDTVMNRFVAEYGLPYYDAEVLTSEKAIALYFEEMVKIVKDPKFCSNWIMTEMLRYMNENKLTVSSFPLKAAEFAKLLALVKDGVINQNTAKSVFEEMLASGSTAEAIVEKRGLRQVLDTSQIELWCDEVISKYPGEVAEYRGGKEKVFGFFVGQVMRSSKGKASPAMVNDILKKKLG